MTKITDAIHPYGTADPENRQTPAPEGFRGERTERTEVDRPDLQHAIAGPEGDLIVETRSGVAYAEALGAGGSSAPGRADRADVEADLRLRPFHLVMMAAGIGIALGLVRQRRARRARAPGDEAALSTPVAFAPGSGAPGNANQTRDVGPAHMRDGDEDSWTRVDEASDASFPASDPPAY